MVWLKKGDKVRMLCNAGGLKKGNTYTIDIVDGNDPEVPYHVSGDGTGRWVCADQIAPVREFHIGSRIRTVKERDHAKAGMVGTIVAGKNCGAWGVRFDDKFDGGHDLDGKCESGYGHWIAPDEMELVGSKPKFKVGQIYRANREPNNGTIVQITSIQGDAFCVKVIRGNTGLRGFNADSDVARSLTLLTGKQIGEAIRKWDDEHATKKTGVKKVKRHAKVGEYIKVLFTESTDAGRFEVGDVLHVMAQANSSCWRGRAVCFSGTDYVIKDSQYVVLEGYKPEQKGKHSYTAEQVERAKKLCGEMMAEAFGDGNTFSLHFFDKNYSKDSEKVSCELARFNGEPDSSGTAVCSDHDEYNVWIGRCVALCKALHKPIPAFIMGD